MRKFLYNVMLFAAVCLVGCQSEQLVEGNETDKNTRTIEIFAEMEGEAGSRTALDGSKGQLKWQAGDQLSVFLSGKQSSSAFTINEGFSSTGATFTGEVQDGGNTLKANVAFYPYNEGVTYNDSKSSLTTSISSTQKSNGNGTFAQGVYPMMAVTDGPDSYNFAFKNVLAGTQLYVKGSGQKIVKVVMEVEGQPLAGDYTVGYSKEGVTTVTPGENTKNSIELDCRDEDGNGMTLNNGDEYVFTFVHFPMPEADRSVTFTLYEENNTKGTGTLKQLKREANIGFSSNTFKHIKVSKFDDVPNTVWVADKQNLVDAVKTTYGSKTTVVLAEDVKLNIILEITGSNVVLDGNGKTLNSTAPRAINVSGANGVTITNLTIEASGERAINIIQGATNVTIDNVTATCANYAVNVASSAKNAVVNIENSNLTGLNVVNVGGSNATITIENTTINCVDKNNKEHYGALSLNKDAEGSQIIATDVKVNISDDSVIAVNAAKDAEIIVNGSTDGVILPKAYIDYGVNQYLFNTIDEAIKYAKDGETVNFIRDVEIVETISIEKNVTINLNGYALDASSNTSRPFEMADDSKLTIEGENSDIKVGKFGLVNIPSGNNAEVILNGGNYVGKTDNGSFLKPRGKGKISLSLNGVTYVDNSDDGYVMDASAYEGDDDLSLTIKDCTFKAAGGLICLVGEASITNTTLETTQSGYEFAAIEMSGRGSGTIQDSSIKSEEIAVSAGYGASITVTNCNVESKEYAYCVYQSGGSINVTSGEKGKYTGKVGIYNNLPLYDPSKITGATGKAEIVIDNETVVSESFK